MVYLRLSSAVAVAATLVTALDDNLVHLDITHRDTIEKPHNKNIMDHFLADFDTVLAKYNHPAYRNPASTSAGSPKLKRAVGDVPVTFDTTASKGIAPYIVNIGINSQTFAVAIDGGSGNLWVPGSDCTSCNEGPVYNEKGTPLHKNVELVYGPGTVNGSQWNDTVTLGGLSATNTTFTVAKSMQGFENVTAVGLLGLSPGNAVDQVPTIIQNLIGNGKLSQPEYSLFFSRNSTGSKLTLGGADPTLYSGASVKVPVTKKSFWQITMDAMFVNGMLVNSTGGQTAVDTGSSLMYTPTDVIDELAKLIPGGTVIVPPARNGAFLAYPCASTVNVALGFGGKKLGYDNRDLFGYKEQINATELMARVGARNQVIERSTQEYCVSTIAGAVLPIDQDIQYLIGFPFVRNWYATFSYAGNGSISFAAAKGNEQGL